MKLDSFTEQYVATALWSSNDDDGVALDSNYSICDVAEDSLKRIIAECDSFQAQAGELITDENLLRTSDSDTDGSYGHDFWLSRNGHGAGYWDGDYAEPAATQLTKLSKTFAECDLYVGDDGQIHLS